MSLVTLVENINTNISLITSNFFFDFRTAVIVDINIDVNKGNLLVALETWTKQLYRWMKKLLH